MSPAKKTAKAGHSPERAQRSGAPAGRGNLKRSEREECRVAAGEITPAEGLNGPARDLSVKRQAGMGLDEWRDKETIGAITHRFHRPTRRLFRYAHMPATTRRIGDLSGKDDLRKCSHRACVIARDTGKGGVRQPRRNRRKTARISPAAPLWPTRAPALSMPQPLPQDGFAVWLTGTVASLPLPSRPRRIAQR